MLLLKILLFPVSILFLGITVLRNKLYDWGVLTSTKHAVQVVSIGNIRVGGSGKTPMVSYLVNQFKTKARIGLLSRGYGRLTKGFQWVDQQCSSDQVGDEMLMLKRQLGDEVVAAVCEDRNLGARKIVEKGAELIFLDDAFQHRAIYRDLDLLLSDFRRPFFRDWLMPSGRLRESRSSAWRAHALIVTNCPKVFSKDEAENLKKKFRPYLAEDCPVFFASLKADVPVPLFNNGLSIDPEVVLVSGIANPGNFEVSVSESFGFEEHCRFPDHHEYALTDIRKIIDVLKKENLSLLTTEKDAVKLAQFKELESFPCFYLPVELEFHDFGTNFDSWVGSKLLAGG